MDADIDQESLALIIELQLQDLRHMTEGNHDTNQTSDSQVAALLMETELKELASYYADKAMSRSVAHAVVADGHASSSRHGVTDNEMNSRFVALSKGIIEISSAADTSTKAGPSSASEESDDLRRCAGCASDVALTGCPCSHDYCRDCMAKLFNAAIGDESLFPPRCCKMAIPIDLVQSCLSAELLATYEAKKLEYMTLNGTYCHVPTYSTLVPLASVQDDVATCIKCQKKTCTICNGESHPLDCPDDTLTTQVLQIAAENGWQRCYSCRRVITITEGCNHIICRCRAQFCYVCGLKWKQCHCVAWDEARIMTTAEDFE
ncbi:hypothetical protein E4U60_007459 [Claviceps pazoutovae]|uniref:RING-type domain-containing protein n=1 Tax=Claviceps pazoutovae TaxID=1649127 RepID=A0A9P7MFY1_9HYPO|nr:hypothetical protein E4U60_007459 [Claviceps pazoutovae]